MLAAGRAVERRIGPRRDDAEPGHLREDDDVSEAVSGMAERRCAAFPIVDATGRLRGIIAQADIATRVHRDKTTGELVEAISEPRTVRK